MLVTTTVTLFFLLVLSGVGLLLWQKRQDDHAMPEHLITSFWVGWALLILFLQIWQIFFPVGMVSLGLLFIAAIIGYYRARQALLNWVKLVPKGAAAAVAGFSGAFLMLLANQATFSRYSYDHGLYHLQMVKWLTTFPLVPGLGNLHHRFAFNNSSFLYAAQMNMGVFEGLAHQTASTLLIFILVLCGLIAVYRLLQQGNQARISHVFYVLMIPFVLNHVLTSSFAGYSTDIVIFVLQILLAGELLELYSRGARALPAVKNRILFIVLLSAAGITVKLSFVVFGGLAILAALAAWFWTVGRDTRLHRQTLLSWIGWGALLIVPWLIRHVILSGYLLYPSTVISFPVKWKIPYAMVAPIAPGIRDWARELGSGTINPEDWFGNWFSVFPFEMMEAVIYALLILLSVLVLWFALRLKPVEWRAVLVVLGITLLSLLYWFWMAPSLRFSGALFWLAIVSGLLLLYDQLRQLKAVQSPHMLLAFMLLLLMFWLSPDFKSVSLRTLILPPLERDVAAEQMLGDPTQYQETDSGLKVFTAAGEADELCWDMPLPCARLADFDPRLSLIDPADMRKGFFIEINE
jgi:hypothetical protein